MRITFRFKIAIFLLTLISCRKPFEPAVIAFNSNILVVEGFINIGSDSTIVRLSRTVVIGNNNNIKAEMGATLNVETDANEKFLLREIKEGIYASPGLNLSASKKYRLSIRTSKGVNYLSDFVTAKVTPKIDSLSYQVKSDGIDILVNTHDSSNDSRYYRWEFSETWEFRTPYFSALEWDGEKLVPRNGLTDNINNCWLSNYIHPVLLGSSARLTEDVIYQKPLTFIRSDAERLSQKYSILAKQYVLTKEAYEFWENLKKNTESLGSIFDAQPSQIGGNVHNVNNAGEPVIGYISAGTTEKQRLFISKEELPVWRVESPYKACVIEDVPVPDITRYFSYGQNLAISFNYSPTGVLLGASGSTKECVDCRLRGTNVKPTFWP